MSLRQLFLENVAQTTDFPLAIEIEKAEGIYLYGSKGEKYIDLIAGIGVSNVGHRHPKVVQAIKDQVDKYLHLMVYGEYIQSPQVLLAKKLSDLLPENLNTVYFVNSGAEATEGALKLAKRYTGRSEIIACHNSYHGSTHGALSVMGNENFKQAYRPLLPDIQFITYGSWSDLERITDKTAAIIIETIQGEAGVNIACNGYFNQLRERCNETGTLLILDEIQTGFGRTGKMFGFEHFEIVPDIVLFAKGIGGGMPLGAFVSSSEIMKVFRNNPILGHITTFGGHPVNCAAALATLNVIIDENLTKGVESKAARFRKILIHPKIKAVRNIGLLFAIEFENFDILKPIIDRALAKGVITDWFLHCNNAMRIAPPLIITEDEIRNACKIIMECIENV
ncbi:MAG: aspartate aminotransferase family protein [Cytophagales bacterium]